MNLLGVSQMPSGEGPLLRHYAINTESRCEIGTLVHKDYNRGAVWSANIPNSPGYQLSVRDHAAVWCWPAAGHVSTDSVVTEPLSSSGLWSLDPESEESHSGTADTRHTSLSTHPQPQHVLSLPQTTLKTGRDLCLESVGQLS